MAKPRYCRLGHKAKPISLWTIARGHDPLIVWVRVFFCKDSCPCKITLGHNITRPIERTPLTTRYSGWYGVSNNVSWSTDG